MRSITGLLHFGFVCKHYSKYIYLYPHVLYIVRVFTAVRIIHIRIKEKERDRDKEIDREREKMREMTVIVQSFCTVHTHTRRL